MPTRTAVVWCRADRRGGPRLPETAPVHARGISKLFVAQLDDQELAVLERVLSKVIIDYSFG